MGLRSVCLASREDVLCKRPSRLARTKAAEDGRDSQSNGGSGVTTLTLA
jgi:hypothetical protein